MQFYARFQNEVVADPAAIGAHVERAREVLGEPFRKVFDEALVEAHDRLRCEAVEEDPAMADVIRARLIDPLPAVAESVSPPSEGAWEVLGAEDGELGAYGLNALTRRLGVIGVSLG